MINKNYNKKFNLLIIFILFFIYCSGCTMIPVYERPKPLIPSEWKIKTKQDTKSQEKHINQISWQNFFLQPELKKLIQKGLDKNLNLKEAALNIQIVKENYKIQKSYLYPAIEAKGQYNRQKTASGSFGSNSGFIINQYTANIATTAFEIDLFGRLRSMNQAALEEYFGSVEAKNTTKILLISEIANAYLKLLSDREQLHLAVKTAKTQKESYDIIAKRVEIGISNNLELRQAETFLRQAEVDQSTLEDIINQDRNNLDLLVGTSVSDSELLGSFNNAEKFVSKINSGLPSDLLQNRPDIRQAEYTLRSANANIGVARASFFPVISLTTSGGFGSTELSSLFVGHNKIWAFTPQVSLPIFTAGRSWAALQVTKLQKDIAVVQYQQSIQNAFREVSDLLSIRKTINAELRAQIKLATASKAYYSLANARYEKGIDNYLGVLDAIRSTYTAQQQVINKRLVMIANTINLYTALGGGYDLSEMAE
ncbi:MAG: efflux transporter outer membrane subunit [Gammaproteobacteria bacterium]|nr:efflux transporter outer membrane subunit [Gammaproteobacteria bacterium]